LISFVCFEQELTQRGVKNQPGEIRLLLVAKKHLRHKEEALALMFLSLLLKRKTNTKVYLTPEMRE
jgi:hypothetical protein